MRSSLPLLALLLATAAPAVASEPAADAAALLPPEQAAIKAHVAFLASDAMKGREAGTPEYDIASEYVAAQMLAAGLRPGGDAGTWFQAVPLVSYRASSPGEVTINRAGTATNLVFGQDFVTRPTPFRPDLAIAGDLVFAGYGISAPAQGHDDYAGLDVRGKIVAILYGTPKTFPSDIAAHLADLDSKILAAEAHGATGIVLLESPQRHELYAFADSFPFWDSLRMTWATPDGKPHAEGAKAPAFAYLSAAGAAKLFAGSPFDWKAIEAADRAGTAMPHGEIGVLISARGRTRVRTTASRNIVGVLEGSDPTLKAQYVVLSAHLDHVGTEAGSGGDRINNGAMDNAVGTAAMLEVARLFQASGTRPKRSMIFLSVTAEEKGLIGSSYFASNPTVPKEALVADVNLDMPIVTYPLKDVVALGGERSSIGPAVAQAAASLGLGVVPDPHPEEMSFVRSDHYSFVQAGIPAISIDTGPGGTGEAAIKEFLDHHYHQPSDDMSQPFDWNSALTFVKLNYGVARTLADSPERPRWNKGDFFGTLYGGYGAK